jgi:HSP20 family protein
MNELMEKTKTAPSTEKAVVRRTVIPEYYVNRDEDAFEITAYVPGVSEDRLDIQYENNWLKLKATPVPVNTEGFEALHLEFQNRDYEAEFKIPNVVNIDAITAKLNNGVLTIKLPKAQEHTPRNIKVTS